MALKPKERLFLQRDIAQDLYVDPPRPIYQHQIDGIRFLYRQFMKKAPGVILNDPSGYGKCLQVTLFLKALRPILKKPILVLTDAVENWKEHFENWIELNDDELAIETTNPFAKKLIFINPVKDGLPFSRRSWSIVVLHDEGCTKDLLLLNFNADYKIWVTRNDLKENLYTLASIYEWLHPNQKFNIDNFTATSGNHIDVLEKAILLDAFLDDFLIRRIDFLSPFKKPESQKSITTSPGKVSRKNKDPTGTKVKRSKRRRIEDDENETSTNLQETTISKNGSNTSIAMDTNTTKENEDNMDVESFIRNEKPIESEEFNFIQHCNDNLHKSITANVNDKSVRDIFRNKSAEEGKNGDKNESQCILESTEKNGTQHAIYNNARNATIVPETEDLTEDSISTKSFFQTCAGISRDDDDIMQTGVIIPETENSETSQNNFKKLNEIKQEESSNGAANRESVFKKHDKNSGEENATRQDSNNEQIHENDTSKSQSVFFYEDESYQDKNSSTDVSHDWQTKENKNDEKVFNENDKSPKSNGSEIQGSKGDNIDSKDKEVVKKNNIIDDYDAKLAELEAKALKQFKGSILDSIF